MNEETAMEILQLQQRQLTPAQLEERYRHYQQAIAPIVKLAGQIEALRPPSTIILGPGGKIAEIRQAALPIELERMLAEYHAMIDSHRRAIFGAAADLVTR